MSKEQQTVMECELCSDDISLCSECEDEQLYRDVEKTYWKHFKDSLYSVIEQDKQ